MHLNHSDEFIYSVSTDSRLSASSNTLFIAIKGERFDGHEFIQEMEEKGVKHFIVHKNYPLEKKSTSNFILVENTLDALQELAKHHRSLFQLPTIAITGSNGKTIVKEWLHQLLARDYSIVKSPKSYNSQIGVPISVLQMDSFHQIGIFEAGISKVDEMQKLEAILKPSIGIFTNLGTAHSSGFTSQQEKLNEKLSLFQHCETLIYEKTNDWVEETIIKTFKEKQLIAWEATKNTILINGHSFTIPQHDDVFFIKNLGHCIALMHHLQYNTKTILKRISYLQTIPHRLQIIKGNHNCQIINDTYNNDLAGLNIALQFTQQQQSTNQLIAILSSFEETGLNSKEITREIKQLIEQYNVTELIGIGSYFMEETKAIQQFIHLTAYPTKDEFTKHIQNHTFQDSTILIKGSRTLFFNTLVPHYQEKTHDSVWEINLSSFIHNINVFKRELNPNVKMMVMVKALAYGAGSEQIATILEHQNIDYLGVAYPEEGKDLRKFGIEETPILVMNTSLSNFKVATDAQLEIETYSIRHLKQLIHHLRKEQKTRYPIHIKLDTGMHRLGFIQSDIGQLIPLLSSNEILVKGIFSHLSSSDDETEIEFSLAQQALFQKMLTQILPHCNEKPIVHLLNSNGIPNKQLNQFDMVRLGIGAYGLSSHERIQKQLVQIGTLKATISQIKHIQAGESIGYSRSFRAKTEMKIGTITIGYADGYDRRFSNGTGIVLVHGKQTKTIGRVCMDMTMIDLTHISNVKEGDEVILTSPELPVQQLADAIETIPYELLTNISERVARKFIWE